MRRRILSVILISFLVIFKMTAQEAEDEGDWFWNKTIAKIEFEGLKNVKKTDLNAIVDTFEGASFTEESFNEILDRLYAMDLFEDVEPYAKHDTKNYDEVLLVFKITERPIITKIDFYGNQKLRNNELRDKIKIKTTDVYVEGKVLLDERILRDYYLEKGYTNSKITHKISETEDGVKVTFVIEEGENTVIKEIHMTGNTIVSERILKSKLSLKEVGIFKDGAFQTAEFEQDKRTIISYYQERGYVDVNIMDVKIDTIPNPEKQRQELIINFIIQEGSQYTFSGFKVSGNEVFGEDKLLPLMKLKAGSIFNEVKFEEGLMAITGLYYENGYMSNQFAPVPEKDTDRKEIAYTLYIEERARSHVEDVIIKGNTKTKDFVIRREIPIEQGDVFSREKVLNGMRNLYNLQYFSDIVPDVQNGSEENLVDVVFNVEEQSTTQLNFGMTFSGVSEPNELPISLYLKLENSNVGGLGKTISGTTTISKNEQSVDFAYTQNWIKNLPITYSQSLSFAHTNSYTQLNMFNPDLSLDQYYHYMAYEGWTASLGTAFGRRWTPKFAILSLTGGLSNSLTRYNYDESIFVPTDLGISMFANRWGLSNSLWASFSMDDRDINYNPSKGWFASEKLAWFGLTPWEKEFFLKSETKAEGYLTLFDVPLSDNYNFKGVFAASTTLSMLFPINGKPVSQSNKLYIDGMFNGRGWTELYKLSEGKGQAMWSTQMEVRVPIVENIVGLDIFHDTVVIKPTVGSFFTDTSINDFYGSFGPGIRVLMPQLPIHLMFAFRYRIIDGQWQWGSGSNDMFQFVLSFNIVNK